MPGVCNSLRLHGAWAHQLHLQARFMRYLETRIIPTTPRKIWTLWATARATSRNRGALTLASRENG